MKDWKTFLDEYRAQLEASSSYEVQFVEYVLSRVEGLDFGSVGIQTPFKDSLGKSRRIDFTIQESPAVRIAIEVDGFDKRGRGAGMTRGEFRDWSRRQSDMSGQGWTVIRFANALVDREPANCARNIELVLRNERAKAAREGGVSLPAQGSSTLSSAEASELKALDDERLDSLNALAARLENSDKEHRRTRMIAVGAAVAVLALVMLGSPFSGQGDATDFCPGGISWQEAASHVGEVVRVYGPVIDVTYASSERGQPTFLNVGRAFPDRSRLTLVIWGVDRGSFEPSPEMAFLAKDVCVLGEIRRFGGSAAMDLATPENVVATR